jgi:peptidyl-prolyl cis-trans isomerase C
MSEKMYHVKHILVEQKYEAEDLLKKLKDGTTFEELAQKFSKCPSGESGGDLGPLSFGRADPSFEEAIETLKPDETTAEPVRTQFGYHLIKRLK